LSVAEQMRHDPEGHCANLSLRACVKSIDLADFGRYYRYGKESISQ
jgi:hypothetical protein